MWAKDGGRLWEGVSLKRTEGTLEAEESRSLRETVFRLAYV